MVIDARVNPAILGLPVIQVFNHCEFIFFFTLILLERSVLVHAVCFNTYFVSNVRQVFVADDFSRRHFQMLFFLGALRVNLIH